MNAYAVVRNEHYESGDAIGVSLTLGGAQLVAQKDSDRRLAVIDDAMTEWQAVCSECEARRLFLDAPVYLYKGYARHWTIETPKPYPETDHNGDPVEPLLWGPLSALDVAVGWRPEGPTVDGCDPRRKGENVRR